MVTSHSDSGGRFSRRAILKLTGVASAAVALDACSSAPAGESDAATPGISDDSAATTAESPVTVEIGDIAAENQLPGSRGWRKGKNRATNVALTGAYAGQSSIYPGQSVDLFVSTTSDSWRVEVYRVGFYAGKGGRLVWRSQPQPGAAQDEVGYLPETRTHFAKWRKSLSLDSADWQPGMYLIRVAGSSGADWLVPLVVKSPEVSGRLVLMMSDLTWQSYNEWGGRSAYLGPAGGFPDRSRAVSFARPYANGNGTGKYFAMEDPVVRLVEANGLPVSYVATSDLTFDKIDLTQAAGLVFLGHDEYWTVKERERVTRARDTGVDLAFLGANTMYWRVRLSQDGPRGLPLQTIYKSAAEDPVTGPETTARFRDAPAPDPERSLVGQEYECYPASGTYTVTDPDFFAFVGTGKRKGDTVAEIVDVEVDRAYPGSPTPKNLQIVAASPTKCLNTQTLSTTTYYSHKSGAGIFSTGTMGWVLRGLREPTGSGPRKFTERVTLNVMRAMLAGQMGVDHPSKPNLSTFDLPSYNTTGRA